MFGITNSNTTFVQDKTIRNMTTQEIKTNIARLEATIKMNIWDKGYVANCNQQIENYKKMLNN